MKVVIFCGGLGVRMGEETRRIPKPMIQIGGKPILWHIMRYYASFGHKDFILCLGYKGEVIKEYFLAHQGALFNDFTLAAVPHRVGTRAPAGSGRRLEAHVRRHRHQRDDRGTPEGGRAAPRGRGRVPRHLRRWPDRRERSRP